MAKIKLGDPVKVSPFIKLVRWALLGWGVMYGATRNSLLSAIETERRAEIERHRPEKEAKAKIERARVSREGQIELARACGVELGDDWEP